MNFLENKKAGSVEGYALIKKCDKKLTSKGVPFLDMVLADKSGEISAKFWDYNEDLHGIFELNTLVKIRGTISVFNGENQLRIERIRKSDSSDNINIEDYVQCSEYDGELMFNELTKIINEFEDEDLKALTLSIINENRDKLLYFPAAYKLHHAIRGGLLLHTLSIVRLAQSVCKIYPFVDCDLLLCGAILHDVAKIEEYDVSNLGIADGYTLEGTLVGHIVRGAMFVSKTAEKLDMPEEKTLLVEHMILSHHGEPDFGAAVRPMFLEAEILSELDLMDARIYEIAQAIMSTPEGEFSNKQWALDNRRLYNHGRKKISPNTDLDI